MGAATIITRTYTPLAFRESTERWLVAMLATVVAALWLFVIPLEIVLHSSGSTPIAAKSVDAAGG